MAKKPSPTKPKPNASPPKTVVKKQSSSGVAKLASDVLAGRKQPTPAEAKRLAASVLSQDEIKGS